MLSVRSVVAGALCFALCDPSSALEAEASATPKTWNKVCINDKCYVGADNRKKPLCSPDGGASVVHENGALKALSVSVRSGTHPHQGVKIRIDEDDPIISVSPIRCVHAICYANIEVPDHFINRLRQGGTLFVEAIDLEGREIRFQLPLVDFSQGYDEPGDTIKVTVKFGGLKPEVQRTPEEEAQRKAEAKARHDECYVINNKPASD